MVDVKGCKNKNGEYVVKLEKPASDYFIFILFYRTNDKTIILHRVNNKEPSERATTHQMTRFF